MVVMYIKELELRYRRRAVYCKGGPLAKHITEPSSVYRLFNYLQESPQEKFLTVHLDTRHHILSFQVTFIGGINRGYVDPAEVFRGALMAGAAEVIVIHNHPGGNPTPGQDDIDITKRLDKAGEIIGVPLVDHVIIGEGCYTFYKGDWRKENVG